MVLLTSPTIMLAEEVLAWQGLQEPPDQPVMRGRQEAWRPPCSLAPQVSLFLLALDRSSLCLQADRRNQYPRKSSGAWKPGLGAVPCHKEILACTRSPWRGAPGYSPPLPVFPCRSFCFLLGWRGERAGWNVSSSQCRSPLGDQGGLRVLFQPGVSHLCVHIHL